MSFTLSTAHYSCSYLDFPKKLAISIKTIMFLKIKQSSRVREKQKQTILRNNRGRQCYQERQTLCSTVTKSHSATAAGAAAAAAARSTNRRWSKRRKKNYRPLRINKDLIYGLCTIRVNYDTFLYPSESWAAKRNYRRSRRRRRRRKECQKKIKRGEKKGKEKEQERKLERHGS